MNTTKKLLALILAFIIVLSLCACNSSDENIVPKQTPGENTTQMPEGSTFSVQFLNMDDGDAALIECDGNYMLINGGNKQSSQKMYAVLEKNNISHLEYVLALNTKEKYIGGLAGALNYATAGITFAPINNMDEDAFNDFKKYADKNGGGITVPKAGNRYKLGVAEIEFMAVNINPESETAIIVKITYGNTVFIFAGNGHIVTEQMALDSKSQLKATVLKVADNGSDNATSTAFIKAVQPEYAVISTSGKNGCPGQTTVSLLDIAGIKLYRTDLHGKISCTSDGNTVTFTTEKQADLDKLYMPGEEKETEEKPDSKPTAKPTPTAKATPTPSSAPTFSPASETTPVTSNNTKPGKQPVLSSPFGIDELYEANLMTYVTANHSSALTSSYFLGTTYYDGTFLVDGKIAKLNTYIYDSGAVNYSGWYNGYTFYVNNMERPCQTVFVEDMDGDEYYPFQMDLSTYFMNKDEVRFKGKKNGDYIYQINTYPSEYTVTVDSETMLIKEITYGEETVVYTFGERVPGQDLLDGWYGGMKAVTVYATMYDNGTPTNLERTFYLPLNWELDVCSLGGELAVYMNKNYTVPYIYPGDGINYEIYVTNSLG